MILLNTAYNAGASIIGYGGSIACNVIGLKDITQAVSHYRDGKIKEAKQSGFKAAWRLIGVATLITGLYYVTQVERERSLNEMQTINANQIKDCFKVTGLEPYEYLDEKEIIDFAASNLAYSNELTNQDLNSIVKKIANFYCEQIFEDPNCNSVLFKMNLLEVIKICRPSGPPH